MSERPRAPFEADGEPPGETRLALWGWLAPAAGGVLLLSPLIQAFAVDARIGGMPAIVVYLFGVWATLILVAGLLAQRDRLDDDLGGARRPAAKAAPRAEP